MVKAFFIDYTGTTVQEGGSELQEVILRVCKNSDLHNPKEVVGLWWKMMKGYEESSYKETYHTEDEIVELMLQELVKTIHLKDNLRELHNLMRNFWIHAPLFADAEEFFKKVQIPVYIISNNGMQYVEESMKDKGLHPAGIICADMVRAYKPHQELFKKALEISGCQADEVLHIGDSYDSDVKGALSAGIRPILVQRSGDIDYQDITTVRNLTEVFALQ